jgi:hypothetical protein
MAIMIFSIGCSGRMTLLRIFPLMMSLAVSVAAQKNGGLSLQPIWNATGMTSYIGS